jgi:hypothetical protein
MVGGVQNPVHVKIVPLATAILVLSSFAVAAQCPTAQVTAVCAPYQASLAANSCLAPGSTFVQTGSVWTLATRTKVPWANQKVANFFSVVDASHTVEPNGLLFVGIIRSLEIAPPTPDVRLSQNRELHFKKTSARDEYSAAVNWKARATAVLNEWGSLPDTDPVFRESYRAQLKDFDFQSVAGQFDLHARLYRFQSGPGIMCIPFYVGTPVALDKIFGTTLDVFGGSVEPNTFEITVDQ